MDLNILKVLIDSDKNRKETAWMLYYFWQNDVENIKTYLEKYGQAGGMFTAATMKVLPKLHRDITNKVLNNLCTVYVPGVDRYLVDKDGDIDEEQTELLNSIYEKAGIQDAQRDWYKAGKLFNCVEVKVVWRNVSNQAEFDLWTPDSFTVWENAENKYLKDVIIFNVLKLDENLSEIEALEVWTPKEHYYMVQNGTFNDGGVEKPKMERRDFDNNNPDGKNKYGIIPSEVLRFKKGEDYYGIGMIDLVEENIWSDLVRSNFVYVQIFQGMGIVYAINMGKSGDVPLTPNKMLCVNDVKADMEMPSIEALSTQAPLSEMNEIIKDNDINILTAKGLSGQTGSADNRNSPALSKALDLEELEIMRKEDKATLESFEERLFKTLRTVHNKNASEKLDENLEFVCNIYDRKPSYSVTDMIQKWRFEINEIGVKSPVDYLIEQDPTMTIDEAESIIDEIKNYKIEKETITDNPDPNDGQGNSRSKPEPDTAE